MNKTDSSTNNIQSPSPSSSLSPSPLAIEQRAVSAAFLRLFTKTKVNLAFSKQSTKESISWNKSQISLLESQLKEIETTNQANQNQQVATNININTNNILEKIEELKRRLSQFKYDLKERESRTPYMATRDVHSKIIKKETDDKLCRYLELPEWAGQGTVDNVTGIHIPYVGIADYFISHSWNSPWQSVVDAVCEHSDSQPNLTFYWIDIFAINQHWKDSSFCTGVNCIGCAAVGEDMPNWQTMQSSHNVGFERVIRYTSKTLLVMAPWDRPRPPTRVWCLYESYVSLMNGSLKVILGEDQRRRMQLSLKEEFAQILSTVRSIDARKADVTVEQDRINIFGAIEQLPDGFNGLNFALRMSLNKWLADASLKFLIDIDPDGPPRSFEQLQVDAKILDSCQCEVYLVRVLECFPGLSDLLTIITVITVSVLLLGPYHSFFIAWFAHCKASSIPNDEEVTKGITAILILLAVIVVCGGYLTNTAIQYQLRRTQLFSCLCCKRLFCIDFIIEWMHSLEGFVINYFYPTLFLAINYYGGSSSVMPFFLFFLCTGILITQCTNSSLDYDEYNRFMEQTGWLLLESERNEEAIDLFEKVSKYWQQYATNHLRARVGMLNAQIGSVMAMHKCNRHDEANKVAALAINSIDKHLRCHRYYFNQLCHKTGGYGWCTRCCHGNDHNIRIERRDWLYTKSRILAADGVVSDDDVLDLLEQAMNLGFFDYQNSDSNLFGSSQWRLMDRSPAFADLTKRIDDEDSESGGISNRPTRLSKIEMKMLSNEKRRSWIDLLDILFSIILFGGFLFLLTQIIDTAGNPCDSVEGIFVGFRGCAGEFAGTGCNLTTHQCFCRKSGNSSNVTM